MPPQSSARKRPAGLLCNSAALVSALLAGAVSAQPAGTYEVIQFRENDPFLFCTKGYDRTFAEMCWIPVSPASGTWMYTGVCRPPNQYGRDWKQRDYLALSQYQRICPKAMGQGPWEGSGDGSQSPNSH